MSQPEALRLADLCSTAKTAIYRADAEQAAAELRRLHAENEALRAELAKPVESDAELEQIQSIYNDYKKPDSQIDKGNLYWALGKCLQRIGGPRLTDAEIDKIAGTFTLHTTEERSWYGEDYRIHCNSVKGARDFARAIERRVRGEDKP